MKKYILFIAIVGSALGGVAAQADYGVKNTREMEFLHDSRQYVNHERNISSVKDESNISAYEMTKSENLRYVAPGFIHNRY